MKARQFGLGSLFGAAVIAGIYLATWQYMHRAPALATVLLVAALSLVVWVGWSWLDRH